MGLLVTPDAAGAVSRLTHTFARNYAGRFNHRHRRTDTLWEGRYKACLADSEGYFLACSRYIELNPVRAWIASQPADYPWPSHSGNTLGRATRCSRRTPATWRWGPTPARGPLRTARCSTKPCARPPTAEGAGIGRFSCLGRGLNRPVRAGTSAGAPAAALKLSLKLSLAPFRLNCP